MLDFVIITSCSDVLWQYKPLYKPENVHLVGFVCMHFAILLPFLLVHHRLIGTYQKKIGEKFGNKRIGKILSIISQGLAVMHYS